VVPVSSTEETPTDGSTPTSVFETEADVEWSWRERYDAVTEEWINEPLRVILSDIRGLIGLSVLVFFLFMGTIGVLIVPEPEPTGPILMQPFQSWEYPLGTQSRGFGMLSMIVHATPNMLKMIASGAVFATGMATVVGTVAGYKGGMTDTVLTALSDIALTIPGLPLVIVVAFIFEPTNPFVVGLLISINAWGGLARALRSQVLTLREESYVEKSRAIGLSTSEIVRIDILPNLMPYVAVNFVNTSRTVIYNSVGLYFLGVLPFTSLNWGVMMNQAYQNDALYRAGTLYWLLIPMFVIILMSLGFLLLAQSLDRVFNPRARTRHEGDVEDEEMETGPGTGPIEQ